MKSIESRKFLSPIKEKSDQMLKLNAEPIQRIHTKNEMISADLLLDKIFSSDK